MCFKSFWNSEFKPRDIPCLVHILLPTGIALNRLGPQTGNTSIFGFSERNHVPKHQIRLAMSYSCFYKLQPGNGLNFSQGPDDILIARPLRGKFYCR